MDTTQDNDSREPGVVGGPQVSHRFVVKLVNNDPDYLFGLAHFSRSDFTPNYLAFGFGFWTLEVTW